MNQFNLSAKYFKMKACSKEQLLLENIKRDFKIVRKRMDQKSLHRVLEADCS
jgi:hypothetical protein